jgi:hypothetical protein
MKRGGGRDLFAGLVTYLADDDDEENDDDDDDDEYENKSKDISSSTRRWT